MIDCYKSLGQENSKKRFLLIFLAGLLFIACSKVNDISKKDIKYTVMYYLWYDLFSGYRRDTLKEELDKLYKLDKEFKNVNTFEQFVGEYNEFITIFTQNGNAQ